MHPLSIGQGIEGTFLAFLLSKQIVVTILFKIIFLGQQIGEKIFLFKMPMHGDGNYCDLVKQMQPRGDLQTTWIMFDHVKRIKGWTTFAYHVYDSFYYKV